jgi:hypothetical protein
MQITFATYTCTILCCTLMNTRNAGVFYIYEDPSLMEKVLRSFQSSGLLGAFGIATSLRNSGEQWLVTSLKLIFTVCILQYPFLSFSSP